MSEIMANEKRENDGQSRLYKKLAVMFNGFVADALQVYSILSGDVKVGHNAYALS